MILNLRIVRVDSNYCDYLRQFDSRVPYNSKSKELRPFMGILFEINECEYFAPLSSPKPKHKKMSNGIDFLKLDDSNLGADNFNNMIPVRNNNYNTIYFKDEWTKSLDKKYQELLKSQVGWLNANYSRVIKNLLNYINYILIINYLITLKIDVVILNY